MKKIVCSSLLLTLLVTPWGPGQEGYRLPPPEVVRLVDAPNPPSLSFSPDVQWILEVEQSTLPSIVDVSRPMLRLAGMRINPSANGRHRTSYNRSLLLRDTSGEERTRVPLPDDARLATTSWSHTSRAFAYTLVTGSGTELWVARVDAPDQPVRISERLNGTLTSGFTWAPDGTTILVLEVPEDRGPPPAEPTVPSGPNVREASGENSPLRTYQDLLTNPHDEALFRYYATSRLVNVDLDGGRTPLGDPAIYRRVEWAPSGEHLLVTRVEGPFSYVMPWSSFPHTIEVWTRSGRSVFARVPMAENIPIGGVQTGPRSVSWRPGEDATLVWVEALDGGDPKREVDHRDRWMQHAPPFDSEPRELLRTEHRAWGLSWTAGGASVLASEYDRDRRWTRTWLYDMTGTGAEPRLLQDRSIRDRYADPGRVMRMPDARGSSIVRQDGSFIYRTGRGASPEGDRPFLDRQNIENLEAERLWRCDVGSYESVTALCPLDNPGALHFVTRHESPTEPPNYYMRDLTAEATPLTRFEDPTPQIRGIRKQLVTYQRNDGVQLSATLYLPAGYEEGTRLPLVVWAYPLEYNDPSTAGQISGSPYRFTRFRGSSHLYFLTQGYAVMDAATMPVIGDAETMNDTFIDQIVASAQAAIDRAAAMGVADPTRVGVGGHSYGAFMTANLLAHCDLFSAGVARSGAYNRTLTPFGFQSERRTLWQAPDAYFRISPFMHAHKINEPLLMIHGERDNNSGTFPIQSERMFGAIKGNGGTARLVFLPNESHGYRARESVLHTLAEMIDWFDVHVRGSSRDQ